MIDFRREPSLMERRAVHTYGAFDGSTFIGRVFQYYTGDDSKSPRWLAQRLDGTIYGMFTPIYTRKAAAEALR